MKVGIVRRAFSAGGGAENYLTLLAEALVQAGHSCPLFASDAWSRADWPHGKLRTVRGKTPLSFAKEIKALDPKSKCDVLLSVERIWGCDFYRAGDGVHASWLDRKAQHQSRWKSWIARKRWENRETLLLESAQLRPEAARGIIVSSQMVKEEIVRYYGFPAERIHVIYNGVPRLQILPELREQTRRIHGFGQEDFVVLFAGSNWERSGLGFAMEAVKQSDLARIRMMVIGRGDRRKWPRSRKVRFVGKMHDLVPCLAAADAFLLPSIYDPFSNACLEALAAGLPVITTDANGFSEIIRPGEEGEVLSDPADISAITNALAFWSSPAKRAAVKSRLQNVAARFNMERNLKATVSLITQPQA
jgi:UDP-glucose:(heptosyl)LPS alpha-1,3-glucosyltransferase